ncbi:MAG: UvrD-helicase domain-containing protein [Planctomycetota bacterium]
MSVEPFVLCGDAPSPLPPGRMLLEAGAGTGKTYTIAGLVLRLVLEADLGLERIAVMTFTRAATGELRARIRAVLAGALRAVEGVTGDDPLLAWVGQRWGDDSGARRRLRKALASVDAASVSTIHGFCQRLLQGHGLGAGVGLALQLDLDPVRWRMESIHDYLRRHVLEADPALLTAIGDRLTPCTLDALAQTLERNRSVALVGPHALSPAAAAEVVARFAAAWRSCGERLRIELGVARRFKHKLSPRYLDRRLAAIAAAVAGEGPIGSDDLAPCRREEWRRCACKAAADEVATLIDDPGLSPLFDAAERLCELPAALEHHFLTSYRAALDQRPHRSEHLAYDDLLGALDQAVARDPEFARRVGEEFSAVLVDEFQDTDPIQYRILDRLFGHTAGLNAHRLYTIGDPKQAIYAFRGADVYAYLAAASRNEYRATLCTNYRSDPGMVAAVNHLFAGTASFVEPAIGFQPAQAVRPQRLRPDGVDPAPLQVWFDPPEDGRDAPGARAAIAAAVAGEIRRLLDSAVRLRADDGERQLRCSDIAVLVNAHHEGDCIAAALAAVGRGGIPSTRNTRQSVFAGREADEVLRVLAAVATPADERAVRSAALTRLIGLEPAMLLDDEDRLERIGEALRALHELWVGDGFGVFWQRLLDHGVGGQPPRLALAGEPGGERAVTNLLQIGDLLLAAVRDGQLGPESAVRWLELRCSAPGAENDEQLVRLDRDDEAVGIHTVHAAKGLEFPIVFVPFDRGGSRGERFAVAHAPAEDDYRARWLLGTMAADDPAVARERLAEDLRLCYVALTRACHRCYLVWSPGPRGSDGASSPLAWLLHRASQTPTVAEHRQAMKQRLKDPAGLEQELRERLLHPEITLGPLPEPAIPSGWRPPGGSQSEDVTGAAPVARWRIPWRREFASSYSGLIRGRPEDEADHDLERAPATVSDALPRGARFGTLVHAIFEHADFAWGAEPEPPAPLAALVARLGRTGGLDPACDAPLAELIHRVLGAQPPELEQPLCALAPTARRAELPFTLPVPQRAQLTAVYAAHDPAGVSAAEGLALPPGFFSGVIDLVFLDGDRYHILDWKSNDLQERDGYAPAALAAEMERHRYRLQAHLYLVALHRHLRHRLVGYRPEQHLGHACYAFVRGVEAVGTSGWVVERPPLELLLALDGCFAEVGR